MLLALAGCGFRDPFGAAAPHATAHLIERGEYQALYDAKGRILRLLQDANHDGVADAQILYWPNGTPRAGELDTDLDGRVDRWEMFGTDGKLARVGLDTDGQAGPDRWERVDAEGHVTTSEPALP